MGRDAFLYNEISQTISALPLPRPEWPHSFGSCDESSSDSSKIRLHPFPIVYLTSNGSKRPHFKIEPTGTNLLQHAAASNVPCSLSSEPPVPSRIGKKPLYHQFEVSGRTKFLATVKSVEGSFGHHKFAYKHVRASKMEAHVFDHHNKHRHLIETVQQCWPHILQDGLRSHMSGDCVLFGVVTKAYTGRLETMGLTSTALSTGVSVIGNGLACSGSKSDYQLKDSGQDANKVIAVDLECFMLLRNHYWDEEDPASPPWLLSKPITVNSWDTHMFQYAVAYCQNRDSWWGNERREEFLDEMQILPPCYVEDEAKFTRSARRHRRRKSRSRCRGGGSDTSSVASWSTAGTGSRVSCMSESYPMPSSIDTFCRLPDQIKIRFDPTDSTIDEDEAELSDPD